jgi:hypothetical protein
MMRILRRLHSDHCAPSRERAGETVSRHCGGSAALRRGPRKASPFVLALLLGCASVILVEAATAAEHAAWELRLQTLSAREAVPVLRSLAGLGDLEIVDERTLRTGAAAEAVAVAKAVIAALENPGDAAVVLRGEALPDGSALASVRLRRASTTEVMTALRRLRVTNLAASSRSATVAIRDTPGQVEAALQAIRALEATPR